MILERYIAGNLVKGWLLVLLVLAAVFGLISFIGELERTRFGYDAMAVGRYTLYTLPHQLVSLAPVIALLGSIVALANLDRSNELTIISCTGFSLSRLLLAIALPTALMMLFLWACMEFITPPLQQSAEAERHALRYRNEVRIPDGGVWSKNGNRYIHLGKMLQGGIPGDIDLFEFDDSGRLTRALHAETARVSEDRTWLFQRVREKLLVKNKLVTRRYKELEIGNLWSPAELPTLTLDSDITLVGSANLDRRSFDLNFENNILLYSPKLTEAVRIRQQTYIDSAEQISLEEVENWSFRRRLWNNSIAMLGPIL